ncbi:MULTISPECIES: toxin Cry1Ac domain D-VI-related protein [unclassified Breznakia]|uniref:toxin Cry1Ac domain D-VI-related protein n=1 Tax=unclassified Breznakia TaxID=2623764 RepID=UPI0024059367|nr:MULTISPECIES: toxin Cry1Ac domain D-VI-related protein [unclassified Breznakia]MDF9837054.1 hypothetical protein [Breznakia sp. PFB2-8]MDF9858979.1 hypothetical protein [Breznakia sp. PH5-24]
MGTTTNEEVKEDVLKVDTTKVEVVKKGIAIAPMAASDPAFPASSQPLHDAILAKYPAIDANNDGVISQGEAGVYPGTIILTNQNITGTITGIENLLNIRYLDLINNQLTGEIPDGLGNLTRLTFLGLNDNDFTGEIPASLGNLVNLNHLKLQNNNFTGSIPSSLGNITSLVNLNLSNNQLTGILPSSLGDLEDIVYLSVSENQLTGEIPSSLGNLKNVTHLNLHTNNFTGSIPTELGNMDNLVHLTLNNNDLSGEVPSSLGDLALTGVDFSDNPKLTGNPIDIFENNDTLLRLDVDGTGMIQAMPDIDSILTFNYDDLASVLLNDDETGLADGVTQEDIDRAQESADYWTEPTKSEWQDKIDKAQDMVDAIDETANLLNDKEDNLAAGVGQSQIDDAQSAVSKLPEGDLKTELQEKVDLAQQMQDAIDTVDSILTDNDTKLASGVTQTDLDDARAEVAQLPDGELKDILNERLDLAQDMLNAQDAVDDLFNPDGTVKDDLTQEDIDNAQDLVDELPDGSLKDDLQDKLDEAQDALDAQDAVDDLFNPDGSIKDDLTQEDIDNAQDLVDELPDGSLKDDLQSLIDEAQKQLDARNKKLQSAASKGTSTVEASSVSTGDYTNIGLLMGMMISSLVVVGFVAKKRKSFNK